MFRKTARFMEAVQRRNQSRTRNTNWRGGVTWRRGYKFLQRPEHPAANNRGYVAEHRLAMEEKLGRVLDRDEVVHHVNGNKSDNRPENLELFASQKEHKAHEIRLGRGGLVAHWRVA